MDFLVFSTINSLALKYVSLDAIGVFFAVYALPLFAFLLIIIGIRSRVLIGYGAVSAGLAYSINGILGYLFMRSRPFVDHVVNQLINKPVTSKSFPSDHAALAFALAGVLTIYYPKMAWLWLLIALCISISRIYVGVHYPTDVIAGACIGILSVYLVRYFGDKKLHRV